MIEYILIPVAFVAGFFIGGAVFSYVIFNRGADKMLQGVMGNKKMKRKIRKRKPTRRHKTGGFWDRLFKK